jgi:hypothetical protein
MVEEKGDGGGERSLPFRLDKSTIVKANGDELRIGLRPIRKSDALALVELFRANYVGAAYELDEVYQESWWKEQVNNPAVYAQVVITSEDKVVGSFIIDKEEEERKIVIGKVTLDLQYKGKGVANQLGIIAINEIAETFEYEVMYSEARTNKPTTQRVLYKSFTQPVAILPDKLSVSGSSKLETSVLMVLPVTDRRIKRKPNLVDSLVPFYEIAKENFGLSDESYDLIELSTEHINLSDCDIQETKKSRFCEIYCNPRNVPTRESIDTLVSERTDGGTRSFLVEVSAYNPEAQQAWLDSGFQPVGYCPAWRRFNEERKDIIFMFKGNLPDKETLYFAEVSYKEYHRNPGTWFIEPVKPIVDAAYGFKYE